MGHTIFGFSRWALVALEKSSQSEQYSLWVYFAEHFLLINHLQCCFGFELRLGLQQLKSEVDNDLWKIKIHLE